MNDGSADCRGRSGESNLYAGSNDYFAFGDDWSFHKASSGDVNPLRAHHTAVDLSSPFQDDFAVGFDASEHRCALLDVNASSGYDVSAMLIRDVHRATNARASQTALRQPCVCGVFFSHAERCCFL